MLFKNKYLANIHLWLRQITYTTVESDDQSNIHKNLNFTIPTLEYLTKLILMHKKTPRNKERNEKLSILKLFLRIFTRFLFSYYKEGYGFCQSHGQIGLNK